MSGKQARIRFVFDVEPDGREAYRVVCGPRDVALWERTGKGRSLAKLEEDASMTSLYEIAYTGSRRQGLWDGPLNEFFDVADVSPVDENAKDDDDAAEPDESDPTNAVP